jgi:ribosomal protein S27E
MRINLIIVRQEARRTDMSIFDWLFGRKKAQKPAAMKARGVGESVKAERDIPKPALANQEVAKSAKVIVVRQQSGFIDIRCPSCGSKCPSFLLADDPVLEDRTWRADCPSCGRAFNFKVKKQSNEPSQSLSPGKSPGSVAYVLVTKQGSKPRDDSWYVEQVLKALIPEALTTPDVKIKMLWGTGVVNDYLAAALVMKYFGTLDLEKYEIVLHDFSDADGDKGTLIKIYHKS